MTDTDSAALVDDLAARIRDRILTGAIPIGAPLRQADLADQFGTSRTPVREALRQLQSTGLVEIHTNRGAVVRVPVPWEIREAYEVRAELEALAARRAADRLSPQTIERMREANDALFTLAIDTAKKPHSQGVTELLDTANDYALHGTIHEAAANRRLQTLLGSILLQYPQNVPAMLLLENINHREENHADHDRILDALAAEDGDLAAKLMRRHVVNTGEQVARWYEQRSFTTLRN